MKRSAQLLIALAAFGVITLCSCDTEKVIGSDPVAFTYLALGDSYTIGESVRASERFPNQLTDSLQNTFRVADPKIIARTGWRSDNLLQALNDEVSADQRYDLVTLLIGVNDQYQGVSIATYGQYLNELFEKAELLAGGPENVLAISIPDYSVTPFAAQGDTAKIRRELASFNATFERIALERNVVYVDITPISKEASTDRLLLAGDGLHPSGIMYTRWVEEMLEEVRNILE